MKREQIADIAAWFYPLPVTSMEEVKSMEDWCDRFADEIMPLLDEFTTNDIDGAYLLGVFNVSGLDGLGKEIKRLKKLEVMPHMIIEILKNKQEDNQ